MTSNAKGVRIGPSSLVTLVAALLLAVLAMLCATSAHAQEVMAQRQADSTTEFYAVDACGQRMLAGIDEQLHDGATSAAAVYGNIGSVRSNALSAGGTRGITLATELADDAIEFSVVAPDGRALDAVISIANGSYTVNEWKFSTTNQEQPEITLWSNTGTE